MKVLIVLLLIATLSLVAAEPSPLTAEENEKLLAALVQHYQARAALLEALAASKAGNTDIERADTALKQVQALVGELQKAHGADTSCSWDYGTKKWACGK